MNGHLHFTKTESAHVGGGLRPHERVARGSRRKDGAMRNHLKLDACARGNRSLLSTPGHSCRPRPYGRSRSLMKEVEMNGCYMRPIALVDSKAVRQVPAYGRGPHEGARPQRRNSVKAARSKSRDARSQRVARRMDDGAAVSRHGRGWQYFSGTVNVHSIIEWMMLAFVIGVAAGLIWNYGSMTYTYVMSW